MKAKQTKTIHLKKVTVVNLKKNEMEKVKGGGLTWQLACSTSYLCPD